MLADGDFVDHRDPDLESSMKPKVPKHGSVKVTLKKGQAYLYCTCGESLKQPFCDGSHKKLGNGYKPLKFVAFRELNKWCACKRNKISAGAMCDKRHKQIEW